MSNSKLEATLYDPQGQDAFDRLMVSIHKTAVEHGWWEDGDRNMGEILCNVHSEVTEAWEEWRDGHPLTQMRFADDGKPEGYPIELADAIIRILDICAKYNIDIYRAIQIKMLYNETRPYRHGGKLA